MKIIILILTVLTSMNLKANKLTVIESYKLPIKEISGLCWVKGSDKTNQKIAIIADDDDHVYILDWARRSKSLELKKIDLNKLAGKKFNGGWESIASDKTGRIFIQQEEEGNIVVLSPDLDKITHQIKLHITSNLNKDIQWGKQKNSAGEGMLLLENGHILITKEKKPFRLIEFSANKSSSNGYNKTMSLMTNNPFPLPIKDGEHTYYSTKAWKLQSADEKKIKDVSEISLNSEGEIFLLSDKSHLVAHIESNLKTSQNELQIKKIYSLPSSFNKAEGMVIDSKGRPIIAIDQKSVNKDNLFLLSPL